jgi:DNA (cytosine-5)-methyltransferase 1
VPRTAGLANTGLYQINNLDGANGYEANKVSHNNDIQQTLRANCGGKLKGIGYQDADNRIRRLTPTECERLQGFPDGWTEGLSDTQRYKTLGNAVSVPVVKAVVERLIHKSSKSHNLHKDS